MKLDNVIKMFKDNVYIIVEREDSSVVWSGWSETYNKLLDYKVSYITTYNYVVSIHVM